MMYPLVQHQRSTTPQNQQNQSTPLQSLSQLLQNQSQTNFQGNNSNQGQQPLQLQNLAQRHAQQIYQNKNIQARQNQNQQQNQQQRRGQQGQEQEQDPDVEQQSETRERHRHRRPLYRRFFNYVREAWTGVKFALGPTFTIYIVRNYVGIMGHFIVIIFPRYLLAHNLPTKRG